MIDTTKLTYTQMAGIMNAIHAELKQRNPLFVNFYVQPLQAAEIALMELAEIKRHQPDMDEEQGGA